VIEHSVEKFDVKQASDQLLGELNEFGNLCRAESRPGDPPVPVEQVIASVRSAPEFSRSQQFVIRDAQGRILASAQAGYEIADHNQHLMWTGINVHPQDRRKGLGSALLQEVVEAAQQASRTTLMGGTAATVPAGEEFAKRIGATPGYRDHTNRLELKELDADLVERWVAEGPSRAPGYSLHWNDGPYGPDLIEKMVPVHLLMNEAPREDLDMEDWKLSREEMEAHEKQFFAGGNQRWSLVVRHDDSDTFVGFTEIALNPATPKTAHQMGTAVDPNHRGHALGKWLKAEMLRRILAERNDLEDVRTANADSNAAMLAINTELGFKPFRAQTSWQISVEQARAYLASRGS
jgi:mycothiol synthase